MQSQQWVDHLDTLLNARAEEIAEERTKEFFDELSKGSLELTKEIIRSEDLFTVG